MDDFDLRDLLSPPLRHCAENQGRPATYKEPSLEPMVLGMAYVRPQIWEDLYDTEDAFRNGTIFRGLDYPFMGRGGNKE